MNSQLIQELNHHSNTNPGGYRDLPPEGAVRFGAQLRVIDVRQPEEYVGELGHLEGAELVPLATVGAAALGWDRSQPLLMVCRSGGRSGAAAATLARMGFLHVYNLIGGMLVWNANQLPVKR